MPSFAVECCAVFWQANSSLLEYVQLVPTLGGFNTFEHGPEEKEERMMEILFCRKN